MNKILLIVTLLISSISPQNYKILSSDDFSIKIELNFSDSYKFSNIQLDGKTFLKITGSGNNLREPGQPWLPEFVFNIGVPFNARPEIIADRVDQQKMDNQFILPYPKDDPLIHPLDPSEVNAEVYSSNNYFPNFVTQIGDGFIFRYARILPIRVSPFQYNPVTRQLIINKIVILHINYNSVATQNYRRFADVSTNDYLNSNVINSVQAKNWQAIPLSPTLSDSNWYNPNKDYYKIYISKKGVYRLTFEYLVSSGLPLGQGISSNMLELFNEGHPVPIDIVDHGDSIFSPGDYIQFIGFPPTPTPYCKLNIYNNSNVYWLSYQSDSSGLTYKDINGYPSYNGETVYQKVPKILHFERDSLYERLGYAGNDLRDFWFWGKASSQSGQITSMFKTSLDSVIEEVSDDSSMILRVDMHGMTNNAYCNFEHKVDIEITEQPIGTAVWDGQNAFTFQKTFHIGEDSIHIYPEGNFLKVTANGDSCSDYTDEIRVNWFELEYQRWNKVNGNYYNIQMPSSLTGVNRYWLWEWTDPDMTVYIPSKNKKIVNLHFLNDEYKSVLFVDTLEAAAEYFCTSSNHFSEPDSILREVPSDLRNLSNGADYIIIAHRKFTQIAEELKNFRSGYFPDTTISNPRIKICYIDEIYDEFSFGMLDPYAVQKFLKYAFENWQSPAPSYIVLMGDMSYDYRHLLTTSRENYIPSIPYYTNTYGLAASDNMFAAVSGNDVIPEMVISRFSIENLEEGFTLLEKIKNYPADYSKDWKQNVLLISSGLNPQDETFFGFNNASVKLEDLYLRPNGFKATKIMRYPNQPQYQQYEGGGPEIRKAINDGTVFVNYYGHGGGYQWDLTFLNDDIYLLENGNRLPFISSVTCYTAHFDNQDVFGEQFIKVPGKGAIAFFGSSGLTLWGIGTYINEVLFNEIFTKREYLAGKAILNAKSLVGSSSFYNSQIALLTLLGEPLLKLCLPDKPDFVVKASDINLLPENPLVDDTVLIKLNFYNVGVVFPNDSINVEISASSSDTSFIIFSGKKGSFGEQDSLQIPWVPKYGGLYTFKLQVNQVDQIPEMDYSDNSSEASFVIYDLNEPNIVSPIDGASSSGQIDFLFSDIGHYVDLSLEYFVEIDTSLSFLSPMISHQLLPEEGEVRWKTPELPDGKYFWRTRLFDGNKYGAWSTSRSFTISDTVTNGYSVSGNLLKMYQTYNVNFVPEDQTLTLNSSALPPKPSMERFIKDIPIIVSDIDSLLLTALTTDGKYLYLANIKYWSIDTVNEEGSSYIYKIGTGYEGTEEGKVYGRIPNFYQPIRNQIFFLNGYIYAATGDPYHLKRIDPATGDTTTIEITQGLLNAETCRIEEGPQYLTTDGRYVYNLAIFDTTGSPRYVLRILDPENGWNLLRPDFELTGTSYQPGFTNFFVAKDYLFPTENYWGNEMRRIRIQDGIFEEEWVCFNPPQGYYAWCYDRINNVVWASVFEQNADTSRISKFQGTYVDAQGNITSPPIGPGSQWKNISYNIENQTATASAKVNLLGLNNQTKHYDTLLENIPSGMNINFIDPQRYSMLKCDILFTDSSLNSTTPLKLKNINLDYLTVPEIIFTKPNFVISPDTIQQGFDISLDLKAKNIGKVRGDSLKVDFHMDDSGSAFYSQILSLDPDSTVPIQTQVISTAPLSPATLHKIKAVGVLNQTEYFTFNNILSKGFYVARDSVKPALNVTIDGKEIINGDVVSSKPDILITLKDESPLPLDTTLFTVVYNNIPLNFSRPDVHFESSPWPDNQFRIRWNPELPDGRHVLEVLAKDPSGNFSDTIARRIVFYIVNSFDLVEVYNYPNPFTDNTYFTFQLYGDNSKLEEFKIKVYTVAGRMIREFDVPPDQLRAGFNKLQWDGKDQDGDPIANGVYFYKVITKNSGETKTKIQKLAKVK